jgi:hypothetical protein
MVYWRYSLNNYYLQYTRMKQFLQHGTTLTMHCTMLLSLIEIIEHVSIVI